ncbi:Trimethyllysine dioxygenase [Saitoella complicata NRRL Y-17804]|uniref:Trimethyllysine dioxygenase n=1 Tax=Saitoella complicata (strain BCRC 22490 / CBS 7301 / JCM 7358 / NBRC 10748 / NRRL Y-17804) TaxID=698492 RepID=UPI0008677832|nr:Trimethyllysine dioxygenase [Saitoella complicata NRRL Y-17804]ODQ49932.1 Trimethyllysine dioxygenase [Saitoella complicata NRRL Y-17804]
MESVDGHATPPAAPPVNPLLSSHHKISLGDRKIHIPWASGKTSTFHHIWLRDHCRCPECFKSTTKQRLVDTYSIPTDIKPEKAEGEKDGLEIEWKDGHKSSYTWGWLVRHSYAPQIETPFHSPKHLWGSEIKEKPPVVQYEDVMKGDEGVAKWTHEIDLYGFCYVEGVPTTPEDTQKLVERIAFIRQTHWGGFYDFTSNLAHHDMAYTNLPLPAHTDNTYFTDPAGLQLFHLLSSDGDGGSSLLVDGFKAARQLRDEHPEAYKFLSSVRIPAHSAGDDGICIRPSVPSLGFPVFNHDSLAGDLFQVRWNNEDRSTMSQWSDVDDVEAFYDAIRHWNAVITNPENEYWAPYEPGKAVIFDNWRVLHGRSAFTGNNRRLCGAYIGMDDFRSRLRMTNMKDVKEWLRAL